MSYNEILHLKKVESENSFNPPRTSGFSSYNHSSLALPSYNQIYYAPLRSGQPRVGGTNLNNSQISYQQNNNGFTNNYH